MRSIRAKVFTVTALVVAIAGLLTSGPYDASAQERSPYRNGDTITIIVPFSAGGGHDSYARLVQPFLEDELQKMTGVRLNVVVTNLDGGGGQVGIERLYRSRPDGRTLAAISTGTHTPMQVIFDAAFDLRKVAYVGQVERSDRSLMIRASAFPRATSLNDVIARSRQKPVLFGTVGLNAAVENFLMELLLNEAGANFKVDYVHFRGTSEVVASMLRGETELYMVTTSGGNRFVEREKDLKWIATLGKERNKIAPQVPTIIEQNVPSAKRITETMGYTRRVLIAPPGLPDETLTLLRRALIQALSRKELHQRADRADLPIAYEGGDIVRDEVLQLIESFARFRGVLKERIGVK